MVDIQWLMATYRPTRAVRYKMRLSCPNCDAQYEVPDEVVPISGRDVQCSNCGHTWFQHHPDHMPPDDEAEADTAQEAAPEEDAAENTTQDESAQEVSAQAPPDPEPEPEQEPAPEPDPAPEPQPVRRELDPAVADILRAEAEAEQQARALRKQEADALESQPDLGLETGAPAEDDRARRTRDAQRRMAKMRGEPDRLTQAAMATGPMYSRRELLPDIEEINSTLRADTERRADLHTGTNETTAAGKGGFGRGFLLVIVLVVVLTACYLYAPQIAQSVPALDGVLTAYVGWVDTLRIGLDGQVQRLLSWLDALATPSAS